MDCIQAKCEHEGARAKNDVERARRNSIMLLEFFVSALVLPPLSCSPVAEVVTGSAQSVLSIRISFIGFFSSKPLCALQVCVVQSQHTLPGSVHTNRNEGEQSKQEPDYKDAVGRKHDIHQFVSLSEFGCCTARCDHELGPAASALQLRVRELALLRVLLLR